MRALAGSTPAQTSTAYLLAARPALGPDETDALLLSATQTLGEDAEERFLGDGVRLRSDKDLLTVGVHESVTAGLLAARAGKELTPTRTEALVDTLSAAIRSPRTAVGDARRVTGVQPTAVSVPAAPNAGGEAAVTAELQAATRTSAEPAARLVGGVRVVRRGVALGRCRSVQDHGGRRP